MREWASFQRGLCKKNKVSYIQQKKTLPPHKYQNTYARLMPAYSVTHHVCHIYNISKKESQDVNFIEITYKIYIPTHLCCAAHSFGVLIICGIQLLLCFLYR